MTKRRHSRSWFLVHCRCLRICIDCFVLVFGSHVLYFIDNLNTVLFLLEIFHPISR